MNNHRQLKIVEIDSGFCRINYKFKPNDEYKSYYYCLQDEGKNYGGVQFYRCSGDFEPDYVCTPKDWEAIEIPKGNSEIEIAVREYLKDKVKGDESNGITR